MLPSLKITTAALGLAVLAACSGDHSNKPVPIQTIAPAKKVTPSPEARREYAKRLDGKFLDAGIESRVEDFEPAEEWKKIVAEDHKLGINPGKSFASDDPELIIHY